MIVLELKDITTPGLGNALLQIQRVQKILKKSREVGNVSEYFGHTWKDGLSGTFWVNVLYPNEAILL